LLPVTVTSDQPERTAPARASEVIEITLAGGYRVRVSDGVQASTLQLVLDVLERR
jgi:transposase